MKYYELSTGIVSWSFDHATRPGETFQDREYLNCWNCGGSGRVEYPDGYGNLDYQECNICNATGELLTTTESIELPEEWLEPDNPNSAILKDNWANLR